LFTGYGDSAENLLQAENPMQLLPSVAPIAVPPRPADPARNALLMDKARALEAAFLTEMLGHAGLGAAQGEFTGGIGEEQFASFLREAQARAIVEKGGLGLAEQLFQSLVRNDHANE
jgi:peptidoglycan hydrolase FlgJ